MHGDFFAGKKITVMGLGLLGGVGDIRFLAESGADLIVTDLKSEAEARPSLDALRDFPNIRYTLGRHDIEDFRGRDLIIKAPSTPLDSSYIAAAREAGTPVTMWAALFCRFAREAGATIVGITGTRGKTTTTAMITGILQSAGRSVIEGGNVRGTSLLPRLNELSENTCVVLELDSWKLQGFGEERISPDIAVFTTFLSDHMNYYADDVEAYFADKANIYRFQTPKDVLIAGEKVAALVGQKPIPHGGRLAVARADDVPPDWTLRIPGHHNRENAACALAAARALGIEDSVSRAALESFRGVPGRLELLREVGGVGLYNDTTATSPDATITALRALDPDGERRIVLIAGGADKGLALPALAEEIARHCKTVILLSGTGTNGTQRLRPLLQLQAPVVDAGSLKEALAIAMEAAHPDDRVLLSPAFASFGMFKNEYDRGDQFNELVRAL